MTVIFPKKAYQPFLQYKNPFLKPVFISILKFHFSIPTNLITNNHSNFHIKKQLSSTLSLNNHFPITQSKTLANKSVPVWQINYMQTIPIFTLTLLASQRHLPDNSQFLKLEIYFFLPVALILLLLSTNRGSSSNFRENKTKQIGRGQVLLRQWWRLDHTPIGQHIKTLCWFFWLFQ